MRTTQNCSLLSSRKSETWSRSSNKPPMWTTIKKWLTEEAHSLVSMLLCLAFELNVESMVIQRTRMKKLHNKEP